jgi:protein ImuA
MPKIAPDTVATLLASRQIARGSCPHAAAAVVTTGIVALDRLLAGGGYPRGGITELTGAGPRHRVAVAALAAASQWGSVAYLSQDLLLHPDVLTAHDARLDQCHMLLETDPPKLFWAAQQLLASGHFACLVLYGSDWREGLPLMDPLAYRRLRGLAQRHHAAVLLILDAHPSLATFSRPCALRLQIAPVTAPEARRARQLRITILRQAGAAPGGHVDLEVR